MGDGSVVERAREAFERRDWPAALELFRSAAADAPLDPWDLERLGDVAYLTGDDALSDQTRAEAERAFTSAGAPADAARVSFWISFSLLQRGEAAQSNGWLARANRSLREVEGDCQAHGLVQIPVGLLHMGAGHLDDASEAFSLAATIGTRLRDPDVTGLGRLGLGQVLIRRGEQTAGTAMLDEVMVTIAAGEVSPITAGIIYCAVLGECRLTLDVHRAGEWTAALHDWCERQPGLVPYRGLCMVHRSEIMQMQGRWGEALEEVVLARDRLTHPPHPAVGAAWYQLAELHRLRGNFDEAEDAYRNASRHGRDPQPGRALLLLTRGRIKAARAAIDRVLAATQADDPANAPFLAAATEISLAAGDVPAARAAADALASRVDGPGASYLNAASKRALGAVLLAEGKAIAAHAALERSRDAWLNLDAPYEAARAEELLGQACRSLGDEDAAALHIASARETYGSVGAVSDLARLAAARHGGGLSPREIEVLKAVAAGKSNRAIAREFTISIKTVERHVSNIFTKLGVSSRAAATAHAYEHDLL